MESEKYKGYEIKISQDECAENPREAWDNLGVMVCFHNRYNLGDQNHGLNKDGFNSWNELEDYIKKEYDPAVILPMYMYDHGIQRVKVGSFQGLLPQGHAEFDSGMIGFIYVSKEKVRKEYSVKKISKKLRERVAGYLESEVKVYDWWMSGQVYGYQVEAEGIDESCWGFYGSDHENSGLMGEAKAAIDYHIKESEKAEAFYNAIFAV